MDWTLTGIAAVRLNPGVFSDQDLLLIRVLNTSLTEVITTVPWLLAGGSYEGLGGGR